MNKKKLVVAGKIIKGKKDMKVDPEFLKEQSLKRTAFRSETETFTHKSPTAARLEMTGVLP
ncbi:MAG: hypothetical protein ACE5GM_11315 [bacterium]